MAPRGQPLRRLVACVTDSTAVDHPGTGHSRIGRSFLLNQLVGAADGFPTAAGSTACTRGLWVWPELLAVRGAAPRREARPVWPMRGRYGWPARPCASRRPRPTGAAAASGSVRAEARAASGEPALAEVIATCFRHRRRRGPGAPPIDRLPIAAASAAAGRGDGTRRRWRRRRARRRRWRRRGGRCGRGGGPGTALPGRHPRVPAAAPDGGPCRAGSHPTAQLPPRRRRRPRQRQRRRWRPRRRRRCRRRWRRRWRWRRWRWCSQVVRCGRHGCGCGAGCGGHARTTVAGAPLIT